MSVTIQSRVRQIQTFLLDHGTYCRDGRCGCTDLSVMVQDEHPRTGERGLRAVSKRVPATLTLLALERRADLPDAILEVPDVKAAVALGLVRVLAQTPSASGSGAPAKEGT